jgi:hypothetical protein
MIRNTFAKGPEGWCSYDYHASMVAGGVNVFVLGTWVASGGVGDSGYVWTDHRRWSADTPERPLSILPLLFYRNWVGEANVDLRGAEMAAYLRGDDLRLDGARCLFWVHGHGTRWHCASQPLTVTDGCWAAAPNRVSLRNDESLWHRSWTIDPREPVSLDQVLGDVQSYGFSFVGFSSEVSGRLSLDEFEIRGGP